MEPLPTPSSSEAMLLPAVALAALGLGPCVMRLAESEVPRGGAGFGIVHAQQAALPAESQRMVGEHFGVLDAEQMAVESDGSRVSPCPGLPRL